MKVKAVSGIMVTLLLIGMLTLAFDLQPVKAQPKTIIVPDDCAKIQWAIGNASDGDTIFVRAGTYYEHVGVSKSVSLVGENRRHTIIDGNYAGTLIVVSATNVKITNFTIQKSGTDYPRCGIYVSSIGNNINISYNIIQNNNDGIRLFSSSNNSISGNYITANRYEGIRLEKSSNYNSISRNNITNNEIGIILLDCPSNNNIYGNNITNNDIGISLHNVALGYNSISGNTITNNGDGIELSSSSNNTISGNNLTNNRCGIQLDYSSNNTVSENNITNNGGGIRLLYSSKNKISRNNLNGDNIHLMYSSNNTISGNNITANKWGGIELSSSSNNTISGNNLTNNRCGIDLDCSSNNSIYGNNITNSEIGIYLSGPSNNFIYHNNFVNNTLQVYTPPTLVSVYPQISSASVGETFTISITVADISKEESLYGWEVYMSFDPDILECTQVLEGPFLMSAGATWGVAQKIDNTAGTINTVDQLFPWPRLGAFGSGVLVNITFQVKDLGRTALHFYQTKLRTYDGRGILRIGHTVEDGYFDNVALTAVMDVDPNALSLHSMGKWITVHVELPEGYDVGDIDVSTMLIDGSVPAEWSKVEGKVLMVKFDRQAVIEHIRNVLQITNDEVTLTITGKLYHGTMFEGNDTIKVMFGGDAEIRIGLFVWRRK